MSGPFRRDDDPNAAPPVDEFRTWLSDRHCPACRIPLYAAQKNLVGLDACGGCGGVWVDDRNAKRLLETKDTAFARIAAAAHQGSEKRPAAKGGRACPDCGAALREGYLAMGGVNVDVCAAHGTWFDAFELVAVVTHLAKEPSPGDFERPFELETPFVQLVRSVLETIKDVLPRAK